MAKVLRSEVSLRTQRDQLSREAMLLRRWRAVEMIAAAVLLVSGLVVGLVFKRWVLFAMGLFAAFLAVGHRMKQRENETDAEKLRQGSWGEDAVMKLLRDGLPDNVYVLNDLLLPVGKKTAQIDHLVISPEGLFIIETKTWAGRIEGDVDGFEWTIVRPGQKKITAKNPVRQNRRQFFFLRDYLAARNIKWPDIYRSVAFASPESVLALTGDYSETVRKSDEIVHWIRSRVTHRNYTEEEMRAVIRAFGADVDE